MDKRTELTPTGLSKIDILYMVGKQKIDIETIGDIASDIVDKNRLVIILQCLNLSALPIEFIDKIEYNHLMTYWDKIRHKQSVTNPDIFEEVILALSGTTDKKKPEEFKRNTELSRRVKGEDCDEVIGALLFLYANGIFTDEDLEENSFDHSIAVTEYTKEEHGFDYTFVSKDMLIKGYRDWIMQTDIIPDRYKNGADYIITGNSYRLKHKN